MTSIIIILFNIFFKKVIPYNLDLDYKEGVNTTLFFIFIDMIIMFMYFYFV
jgi:hypothetical protein